MHKGFVFLCLLGAVTACGQANPGSAGLNVTGNWTGSFADSSGTLPYSYALQLTQQGADTFSGTYTTSTSATPGSISGSVMTGKSTITTTYGTVALQGAFNTTTYEGTFATQPSDSATPVQSGTFTFTKAK